MSHFICKDKTIDNFIINSQLNLVVDALEKVEEVVMVTGGNTEKMKMNVEKRVMRKNGEIIKVEAKATRKIKKIGRNKENIVKNKRKMKKN